MRLRYALLIAIVGFGVVLVPACSNGDTGTTAVERSSTTTQPDDSTDPGSTAEESTDSTSVDPESDVTSSGQLVDCFKQASTFSKMFTGILTSPDTAKDAQLQAEELKKVLPENLHDDIDVISKAIGEVAEKGVANGSEAMGTPEYESAVRAIGDYFAKECPGGN